MFLLILLPASCTHMLLYLICACISKEEASRKAIEDVKRKTQEAVRDLYIYIYKCKERESVCVCDQSIGV